jgi:hypothetical protein
VAAPFAGFSTPIPTFPLRGKGSGKGLPSKGVFFEQESGGVAAPFAGFSTPIPTFPLRGKGSGKGLPSMRVSLRRKAVLVGLLGR